MKQDGQNLGRRWFLTGVGAAVGAIATSGAGTALANGRRRGGTAAEVTEVPAPAGAAEQATIATAAAGTSTFGSLRVGDVVDRWSIVAIHAPRMGAVAFVLETSDQDRFQVDVLRRDRRPRAPAGLHQTNSLSLFLANRGDGRKATDEEQGLGAMALGQLLSAMETEGHVGTDGLLTHRGRRESHPIGAFSVPLR